MKRLFILLVNMALITTSAIAQEKVILYKDSIPNSKIELSGDDRPMMEIFTPLNPKPDHSAILIFPGGAYSFLAYKEEGIEIAKAFSNAGLTAIVVSYRLPKPQTMEDKSIGPLMDAQQAIKIVRTNAKKWSIDPKKIGVIGFSAGGHLASTLGTHYKTSLIPNTENTSLRPDFMVLIYPVITMQDSFAHFGSKIALLGMDPSVAKVNSLSNEKQVSLDTPPTYLTHCGDDKVVDVHNSILFYEALQNKGVDAELHIYPKGDHGFTQELPVKEWLNPILLFLKKEGFYNN